MFRQPFQARFDRIGQMETKLVMPILERLHRRHILFLGLPTEVATFVAPVDGFLELVVKIHCGLFFGCH